MKRIVSVVLVALMVLMALSGCGTKATEPRPLPQSSQSETIALEPTNERIPAVELGYNYFSFNDALPDDLPQQLVIEDETAYRLARTIQNYLCYGKSSLGDFDGQLKEEIPGLVETVTYHTDPINFVFSYDESGFACEEYPNHVITKLAEQLVEQGKYPCLIAYAEDVKETAVRLFGDTVQYQDASAGFFEYFPEEGVYIQFGDIGGARWPYPQVTAYNKTEDGYVCEVILVSALGKDTPILLGEVELTKENFAEATAGAQKLRYHFKEQDGHLILTGLETLA